MSARTLSKEGYSRLKTATRILNRNAGGLEAAAMFTRIAQAQLGHYQNLNNDDRYAPIDVIADLENITGTPIVTQALCSLAGGYFTPIAINHNEPVFAAHLAKIGKEVSEVMGEAAKALVDGDLSTQERHNLALEIDDAIAALANTRAFLTRNEE